MNLGLLQQLLNHLPEHIVSRQGFRLRRGPTE